MRTLTTGNIRFFIVKIFMEELKLFQSPIFGQVRTVVINGQVMFAATDVAKCLGYANPQKAVRDHCKSAGVNEMYTPTNGGIQKVKFITKGNIIRLVASSELPQAEEVESWIFDEVIPTVLETGGYIATKQGDTSEEIMARALVIAQNTITRRDERVKLLEEEVNAQSAQISNLTPKAEFADCFLSCKGDITIGELANILNQSCLFSKGRNKLREWLRKNGYLIKRGTRKNKPTQKSMSLHLMRIASTLCNTGEKNVFREEVMVTARGQKHFITQFRALLSSKESYEIEW